MPSSAKVHELRSLSAAPLGFAVWLATVLLGIPPQWALLAGVACAWISGTQAHAHTPQLASQTMKLSVVLLGFGLSFSQTLHAGATHALPGLLSIAAILGAGLLLGRLLKVENIVATLIAGGTAICGGSAIAALAPTLSAKPNQTAPALGVVFLLNGLALALFPAVGHLLGLSQESFGLWSALAIHDTSSVAGAAAAYGNEALALALPVKLTRALWIVPLCALAPLLVTGAKRKIPVPWFLGGFLLTAAIASALPQQVPLWQSLANFGKHLLAGALFLTGLSLSPAVLKQVGWRPLAHGALLWILAAGGILLVVWSW